MHKTNAANFSDQPQHRNCGNSDAPHSPIDRRLACYTINRKPGVVGAVIPALGREKQADLCAFNTSLIKLARSGKLR